MQAVQSPLIPIIGELIRNNPGTIFLGQGVVYYGSPPEAIARLPEFLANPDNHKYQAIQGIAPLLAAISDSYESIRNSSWWWSQRSIWCDNSLILQSRVFLFA